MLIEQHQLSTSLFSLEKNQCNSNLTTNIKDSLEKSNTPALNLKSKSVDTESNIESTRLLFEEQLKFLNKEKFNFIKF